jgi:hypothetical protein
MNGTNRHFSSSHFVQTSPPHILGSDSSNGDCQGMWHHTVWYTVTNRSKKLTWSASCLSQTTIAAMVSQPSTSPLHSTLTHTHLANCCSEGQDWLELESLWRNATLNHGSYMSQIAAYISQCENIRRYLKGGWDASCCVIIIHILNGSVAGARF